MVQEDVLRMFIGLLSLIPFSFAIQHIPNSSLRYGYSLLSALLIQYFVFQSYMYPIYAQHLLVFAIIKLKKKNIGGLVTFQSMVFLSGYQIYEYLYNYGGWTMNASALLMILVCKYSLLAYNIDDGREEESKLTAEQLRNRVTQSVGFLDFMGYVSFLPTCLIGPPLEYNDFKNFMEKKEVYGNIPSVFKVTGKVLLQMIVYLSLYQLGEYYAPIKLLKTKEFYKTSSPAQVFLYATISIYLLRCKYYFGWKLSMGAVHASGVSFDGTSFNKINAVNPWIFETAIHPRDKISNWNMSVQDWLRKGIYNRSPIKSRALKQLYVFLVSAFWHGFYPAYYISFTLWFVQLHVQNLAYKYFKNGKSVLVSLYERAGLLGNIILSNVVMLEWSHLATYFLIQDTASCWNLMKSVYFIPQLLLVAFGVIFSFLPVPKEKKEGKEAVKQDAKEQLRKVE